MSVPKVFISYNRADREWAEWIAAVIEGAGYAPFLQAWHILPGMNFGVEMHKAASETDFTIAVLSNAFLKSEFTLSEWIGAFVSDPTGRKRKLIPVRVAKCDPTGLLTAIVYIDLIGLDESAAAKSLLDGLKPTGKPGGQIRFPGQTGPAVLSTAPFPPSLARLHFVPDLPPHFLPRAEMLAAAKAQLLGNSSSRLAITGLGQAVGVQGMGGIGKSVLAAALARGADVRHTFPDGVVWLAVGQQPNVIELQGRLLRVLTGAIPDAASVHECAEAIREALDGRKVLLILDDVWEPAHAELFRGIPNSCRLLVTTRNLEVLTGLEAAEFRVDLLSPEEALHLLADWSGLNRESLPPEAPKIAHACGQLPLALAAIGAMVRLGPTAWEDALTRLRRADLDKVRKAFPNYPHPHLLRALEVSVEALPSEDRERYLDLAAFPEEIGIPEGPLRLLWNLDDLDTRDLMRRLAARSLTMLKENPKEGLSLTLHDLLRDLVRKRRNEVLPQLHERLVNAYGAVCAAQSTETEIQKACKWSRGPNDGYFFQWLPWHLKEAGMKAELRRTLLDFEWLQAKLNATSVRDLIKDYDIDMPNETNDTMRQVLRAAAPLIADDGKALGIQLLARLPLTHNSLLEELRCQAKQATDSCAFRPLFPTMCSSGLLARLENVSADVARFALTPDRLKIVGERPHQPPLCWDITTGKAVPADSGEIVDPASAPRNGDAGTSLEPDVLADAASVGAPPEFTLITRSADGSRIAAASWDGRIAVREAAGNAGWRMAKAHASSVIGLWFLDRDRVVSYARVSRRDQELGEAKLWDFLTVGSLPTWEAHLDWVRAASISPGLDIAATVSVDCTLKIWETKSGKILWETAVTRNSVGGVAIERDGRFVLTGDRDHMLKLWDLKTYTVKRWIPSHCEPGTNADGEQSQAVYCINAVAFTSDGNRAIIAADGIYCVDVSHDAKRLEPVEATALLLPGLEQVNRGKAVQFQGGPWGEVCTVAISPDDSMVIAGAGDLVLKATTEEPGDYVRVLDFPNLTLRSKLPGHQAGVTSVVSGKDGNSLVGLSASADATVICWDLNTCKRKWILTGHIGEVRGVSITPDCRYAVSAGSDRTLRLWDLAQGVEVSSFAGDDAFTACAIGNNGRLLVAGDANGRVHFFELRLA